MMKLGTAIKVTERDAKQTDGSKKTVQTASTVLNVPALDGSESTLSASVAVKALDTTARLYNGPFSDPAGAKIAHDRSAAIALVADEELKTADLDASIVRRYATSKPKTKKSIAWKTITWEVA